MEASAIRRVALIGVGVMGPGIAARLARGGLSVAAHDESGRAMARAEELLRHAEGALDQLDISPPPGGVGAVQFHSALSAAVDGADLVIENVPEQLEAKAEVYRAVEPLMAPDALLVSDTSGIPITRLQTPLARPERFAGMHWSNPPHIIPMIEVIPGERTAPATVESVRGLIARLGLLPVVLKRDVPGFVENRILYALLRESVDLVEQGVIDAEQLDTCVSWGIGYKLSVVGPMRLLDMAGLDIYEAVSGYLNQELCARRDVSPMVTRQTKEGRRGMKTGAGLFDYSEAELSSLPAGRARRLIAVRKALEGRDTG